MRRRGRTRRLRVCGAGEGRGWGGGRVCLQSGAGFAVLTFFKTTFQIGPPLGASQPNGKLNPEKGFSCH